MTTRLSLAALLAALGLPASTQDFPLAIEHRFGTTVIEAPPERVATVDFNGADNLLALGVQPVTVRDWFGDQPRAVWPWADPLHEGTPTILRGDEIDVEAVAAADPDVILAVWSGISAEDYARLSLAAPTVAVPEGVDDYALPWDELALITGRVVGREAEAAAQVAALRERLEGIAADHPDWAGQTTVVATHWEGTLGAYGPGDVRPQLLAEIGFVTPPAVAEIVPAGAVHATISEERLDLLDADLDRGHGRTGCWLDGRGRGPSPVQGSRGLDRRSG